MKSSAFKQPYFSAYPLKSVPDSASEETSYLHINTGNKRRRFNNRLFLMPMVDPYREEEIKEPTLAEKTKSDYIQTFDTEWYNHYE